MNKILVYFRVLRNLWAATFSAVSTTPKAHKDRLAVASPSPTY